MKIAGQGSCLNIAAVFLGKCSAFRSAFHKMQMTFSYRTWRDAIQKEETALKGTLLRLSTAAQLVSGSTLTFNGWGK